MHSSLTEYERNKIAKLPAKIAELADRYLIQVLNVADSWDKKPLPENYTPHYVSVYCGDNEDSSMLVLDGELIDFTPVEAERKSTSLSIKIDGTFVYIEIEGQEILNKLGGVVLPEINLLYQEIIPDISLETN